MCANANKKEDAKTRMSLQAMRNFLLGGYHDLPNVLFMGSLVIGSITGYLPLVFVALGFIVNGGLVATLQGIFNFLMDPEHPWSQIKVPRGMGTCNIIVPNIENRGDEFMIVAPSHWLAAATYFAVFVIFNSLQVAIRPAAAGADGKKVQTRQAVSLSSAVVAIVFLLMIFARGFTGCETYLGAILGIVVGAGVGIGWWYLLDACGSGTIPDILQIAANSAPTARTGETAVVCSTSDSS